MSVFVMDTLGEHVVSLFHDTLYTAQAAWSPDGRTLAISRGSANGDRHIYLIDPDGKNLRQLSFGHGVASWPTWSADGKTVVFDWDTNGNLDIYRIPSRGGSITRLTSNPGKDNLAKWNPRDSTIAFSSRRNERWEVFTMNADGSNEKFLVAGAVPIFSRSGEWVLYQASPAPQATNFFLTRLDGSRVHQLTMGNHSDANASFSPNDSSIVFCSNRTGSYELYRMPLWSPSSAVQLTRSSRR
jgi:TolB protein